VLGENAGQTLPCGREVPAHGDSGQPEHLGDLRHGQLLQFVKHDDRPPSRREPGQRCLDGRARYRRRFRVGRAEGLDVFGPGKAAAHGDLSGAITTEIDQDSHQPCLGVGVDDRQLPQTAGGAQKGLLNEIAGVLRIPGESASQAVKPLVLGIEERCEVLSPDGRMVFFHVHRFDQ